MKILVLNSGSSSIKYALFDMNTHNAVADHKQGLQIVFQILNQLNLITNSADLFCIVLGTE